MNHHIQLPILQNDPTAKCSSSNVSVLYIYSAAIGVSCQEPALTSTLREGNRTCPGDEVIFTCIVRESTLSALVLGWTSSEYISGSLQFSTANTRGDNRTSTIEGSVTATATLTNNADVAGVLTLESELRIVAGEASIVTCSGSNGGTKSIEFSVSGTYINI